MILYFGLKAKPLELYNVKKLFPGISHYAKDSCEICVSCKYTKVSLLKKTQDKTTKPFGKVFVWILGRLNLPSVPKFRYVLMLINSYSEFEAMKSFCALKVKP